MKITVWTFTSCIPQENNPVIPNLYASEAEAEADAERIMQSEWETHGTEDDDGNLDPYPGGWRKAQDIIAQNDADETWGLWIMNSHMIDVPEIAPLDIVRNLLGSLETTLDLAYTKTGAKLTGSEETERRMEAARKFTEWRGSPDPTDPDNFWIDDDTGERVNAHTGERAPA